MLPKPISFSASVLPARCSSVLTSTLCLSSVTVAGTVLAPIFSRYWRPGSISSSVIQRDVRGELVGDFRPRRGRRQDVAARHVDLVGEGERHRFAGRAFVEVAVHGDDARDLRGAARARDDDGVARLHAAAGDRAGEAAEIEIGAVHPLHRHAERLFRQSAIRRRRSSRWSSSAGPLYQGMFGDLAMTLSP